MTSRTQPAPIQAPLTPDPEPSTTTEASSELLFVPESLREHQINSVVGGSFRLADFSDKVIVINFWASWCGPCRREVPEYEKVRKEYARRAVEFIGLTPEDPRAAKDRVNKFINELRFGFRLGWADSLVARTLMNGKGTIPQTLVLDGEGHIISHWTGYSSGRSGERLRQTIDNALKNIH